MTSNIVDVIFDSGSKKNNSGTPDQPYFTLQPALHNIVGMALLWVNIPFTYYVTDDYSNTFRFKDSTFDGYIQMPAATYNGVSAIDILNNLFRTDDSTPGSYTGSIQYVWYLNQDTGKIAVYTTNTGQGSFFVEVLEDFAEFGETFGFLTGENRASVTPIDFYDG